MCINKAAYIFLEYFIKLLLSYCHVNFLILGEIFSDQLARVTSSPGKYVIRYSVYLMYEI